MNTGASPEHVWSVLADYGRDHEWRAGVEMRQEPLGLASPGALTYERLRFLGSVKRVVARIEEVKPGVCLRFRSIESDVPLCGERRVEPWGTNGSRVTVRVEMAPTGVWKLFAKPMASLFKRRFAKDLERLAKLVA